MKVKNLTINDSAYPSTLRQLSAAPKQLFYMGAEPSEWLDRPRVSIVGSRGVTPYGQQVTTKFAAELSEYGIVIVSGLALGVDGIAHQACVRAGGTAVAVLPCGLDRVYPASHTQLARDILTHGGTLLSEYEAGMPGFKQNFIARNRIVAGLADALLITEATDKSGTLHTARFALEQGRDVLVVPGNITSPNSVGTNNLIKAGAQPVTSIADILHVLGLDETSAAERIHRGETAEEQALLDLLYQGTTDGHRLLSDSNLSTETFTQTLTMLELGGKVQPLGNNHWAPR
jgi:DNA processing protein